MKELVTVSLLFLALSVAAHAQAPAPELPPIKRLATARAVVDAHLAGLNTCDYRLLMSLYPADAQLFLPGGKVVKGRAQVAEVYRTTVKPFKDGGACGLKFEAEYTFAVGDTLNVQWRATADFLAAPYRGVEAYVTRDGLMQAQVTTYDRAQIKIR